jgi:hypothetical protein
MCDSIACIIAVYSLTFYRRIYYGATLKGVCALELYGGTVLINPNPNPTPNPNPSYAEARCSLTLTLTLTLTIRRHGAR